MCQSLYIQASTSFCEVFICVYIFRQSGQDIRYEIAQKLIRIVTVTDLQITGQMSSPIDIPELNYLLFFNRIILMLNAMHSHLKF